MSACPVTREDSELAAAFRALGDPTRLRIFRFLASCRCAVALCDAGRVRPVQGMTVGEVCCNVTESGKITSTFSHHLRELRLAGLVTMEKRGRHVVCAADPRLAAAMSSFLAGCARGVNDEQSQMERRRSEDGRSRKLRESRQERP